MAINGIRVVFEPMRAVPDREYRKQGVPMERRRVRFDTHAFYKKLVAAGIPSQQADAYVCLLVRLIRQKFASDKHLDEPSQTAQPEFRFDTAAATEELLAAGFPERQADALVCSLVEFMNCRLAISALI